MSSSSTSSSSSSNSGSSESNTDSDESSSTAEEKEQTQPQSKSQVVTRRSSECKAAAAAKETETEKKVTAPPKPKPATRRQSAISSGEDNAKSKQTPTTGTQRKKATVPAAAPAANKAKATTNQANATKTPPAKKPATNEKSQETTEKLANPSTTASDESDKDQQNKANRRQVKERKPPARQAQPQRTSKIPPPPATKRNAPPTTTAKNPTQNKSSNDSDTESGSASEGGSSSESSESEEEASDSSNSFMSQPTKAVKGKRATTTVSKPDIARKLTRSFSTRQNKQQVKPPNADNSNTDTDMDDIEKRSSSKSPAKKANTASKSKVKKEICLGLLGSNHINTHPPSLSPQQTEKKCPIEGCDSSGHLSGNLEKHFLPEACPIYHNMSASECKERANERRIKSEQQEKTNLPTITNSQDSSTSHRILSTEQREFLGKIKESRARFRPIGGGSTATTLNMDKIKLEKECNDEDREPSLNGMVPDYDLQLFREAQALASEQIEDEVKELPVGKGIKYITMGKYKMKVWYQSPYPDDAARLPQMYICEFCLRYRKSETGIKRHAKKCLWRHPPGDEIYRKGKLQVWQVDGKRFKQYCQHLCLLAKFFLDHKTLYYDVEPFLFYIMTLADVDGCHTVGYFSKEKNSFYNVSCILTLPPYQRKGYGRLLIDFSYLLTRVEGKIGSPEKPLSDLGLISYRSYWKDVLLDYLCSRSGNTLSIKDVSQEMAIYSYDIVSTLQALGMMKYWKGKHIVLKKQDVLDEYEERVKRRGNFPKIDESCLRWSPFVPNQTNNSH